MKNVSGGDAPGQRAIDRDVFGVENIFDPDHRRDRDTAFVNRLSHDMGVAIDDAGHHILARSVDHRRSCRREDLLADLRNLAVLQQD